MGPDEFNAWLINPLRRPLVLGILNVTPDSFSDGGQFATIEAAVDRAVEMARAGADWLDIGGESTRPGSHPVDPDEQIRRTVPVIEGIKKRLDIVVSIDTTSAEVASAAMDAGATIINDVSAGRNDANLMPLAARRGAAMVLMHMQGTPATMQLNPVYVDVTAEISRFLTLRRQAAIDAGITPHRVLLDPGLGFGKTLHHNLRILRQIDALVALGQPIVIGPSRKGFIGQVTGAKLPEDRLAGTAAVVAWCIANQVAVVRVHDIEPIVQVVRMIRSIKDDIVSEPIKPKMPMKPSASA